MAVLLHSPDGREVLRVPDVLAPQYVDRGWTATTGTQSPGTEPDSQDPEGDDDPVAEPVPAKQAAPRGAATRPRKG